MQTTIDGIQRFKKLFTITPYKDDIQISVNEFDDIMKTVNYIMNCFCGFDQVIEKHSGKVIAYTQGRGDNAICFLDSDFAKKIKYGE